MDLTVGNEHQAPNKAAARFLLLSLRGALHSPVLPPTPVVSGSCPAHCLTHLSVTSSTSGEGEQGDLAGRQRCPWCGRDCPCTHNDQMRSGGCFSFGFVSCFFHQVCFVWGKEELTPPARLPLWVWYNLFCTQRITIDGSDDASWLATMLTALFLGPCERLQGRTNLMEGKYWLPGIR